MLGTTPTKEFGKHKIILGVPWNTSSDRLLFDVSELAHLAKKFQPESCQCNWQILPPFWSLTPIITSVSIESRKLKKNRRRLFIPKGRSLTSYMIDCVRHSRERLFMFFVTRALQLDAKGNLPKMPEAVCQRVYRHYSLLHIT